MKVIVKHYAVKCSKCGKLEYSLTPIDTERVKLICANCNIEMETVDEN